MIGGASTLIYGAAAVLLSTSLAATVASFAAYAGAAIFSYAGHKYFTFGSAGDHAFEVPRFAAVTALGLAFALLLPLPLVDWLQLPPAMPILATCIVVPMVNYFVLDRWVFAVGAGHGTAAMSVPGCLDVSRRLVSLFRQMPVARRNIIAIIALTLLAVVMQTRWGTIPDTSWLITVCERILAGEKLYTEIYETNPPFTVWLYLPPVTVAHLLNVKPEPLVQGWTYLASLGGLGFAGMVLVRAGFRENAALFAFAPAFYAMLVIYPGNAFTEREHIGIAMFLPMLVLMAWRARTDGSAPPGKALAAFVGLVSSTLLLVKPHYAVMILCPVLFVCWRQRSLWPILAVEHWVIGFVCSAYLAAVLVFYPEFIRDIYPVLADTYLKIRSWLPILILYGFTWSFLMFVAWRLWPVDRTPELASVAVIASVSGILPLVWQGKGWPYHAYPTLFCAVVAVLCLLALPVAGRRRQLSIKGPQLLMRPSGVIVLTAIISSFAPFWATQKPSADIVAAIRAATMQPTVALIGADMAYGHPLNRMVNGRWASTHVSDWLGTFALYLSHQAGREGNVAEEIRYAAVAERYAAEKHKELLLRRPDIIAVQKNEPFWTSYLARLSFDRLFAHYRLLAEDGEVSIYLRERPLVAVPLDGASGQ